MEIFPKNTLDDIHERIFTISGKRPIHDHPDMVLLFAQQSIAQQALNEVLYLMVIIHAGLEVFFELPARLIDSAPGRGAMRKQVLFRFAWTTFTRPEIDHSGWSGQEVGLLIQLLIGNDRSIINGSDALQHIFASFRTAQRIKPFQYLFVEWRTFLIITFRPSIHIGFTNTLGIGKGPFATHIHLPKMARPI